MKAVAVLLGLLTVLFAYLFFSRGSAVSTMEAQLATNQIVLTNSIRKFETDLALTNMLAGDVRSNLQHIVDVRTAHLNIFSNRLVQANLLIQAAQEGHRVAQSELQGLIASNATLAVRQEELERQLTAVPRLESQLTAVRRQAVSMAMERDSVAVDLQNTRVEHAELLNRLEDPAFLRAQIEKAEDAAALRKKAASRPISPTDRRLPIALQADGTVRPVPPK